VGRKSVIQERNYADHDLPMLRVHAARQRARDIAEAAGVDEAVAEQIAREVVAIIGQGTKRWGHLCPDCRRLVDWDAIQGPTCPEHGRLRGWGLGTPLVLLISFDPIQHPLQGGLDREANDGATARKEGE
jgi:hypothetical protein